MKQKLGAYIGSFIKKVEVSHRFKTGFKFSRLEVKIALIFFGNSLFLILHSQKDFYIFLQNSSCLGIFYES